MDRLLGNDRWFGRAGVGLFDHPSNLRHPTRWHARGYSLNAANPFALKSFTKDPAADGGYTLSAGSNLRLRYRAVIYEGRPTSITYIAST